MSDGQGTYHRYTNTRGEECVKHIDHVGAPSFPGVWTIADMSIALLGDNRNHLAKVDTTSLVAAEAALRKAIDLLGVKP